MSDNAQVRIGIHKDGWWTAVLLLISFIASLVYLRVGLTRVFYPYALDLVEEAMLMQAWRVAQGLPVFVPPNAEFVPQVYMPLFTWLGGQLLRLTGFTFWPLRLLSFLSTVGTAVLLVWIGWRESGSKPVALAGAALFLAGFRLVGGWYDLARVDSLFTFLCVAGLVVVVYGRSLAIKTLLGGLLLGLAFLTKQNGLLLAVMAGFCLFTAEGAENAEAARKSGLSASIRVLLIFVTTFAVVAVPSALIFQLGSDGWFSFYTVTIAYASPLELVRLWDIFRWELVAGMGVLVGLWVGTAVWQLSQFNWRVELGNWRPLISNFQSLILQNPWLLFSGTAVFISVAGRATVGGNLNNMIVGYALLCLAPALSWRYFSKITQVSQIGKKSIKSAKSVDVNVFRWFIPAVLLIQFGLVLFPLNPHLPTTIMPTAAMRMAGDTLVAQVAATEGEVWLLSHPSYAVQAGKRPYVHLQSLWHARQRGMGPLPSDLISLIEQQQFAQIISDESDFFEKETAFLELLQTHYEAVTVLTDGQSPPTLSGPIIRPLTVYVPRR